MPQNSDGAVSLTTTQSLTSKQWVIPPRPKPGRKPATDTPPTKRKAQNRAAQRAFRERRAAKVGELEDQIDDMIREHQNEVEGLGLEIDKLHNDFDTTLKQRLDDHEHRMRLLQAEIGGWQAHCAQLKEQVSAERRCRLALESELAVTKGQAVRLPPRFGKPHALPLQKHGNDIRTPEEEYQTCEETMIGCSKCSLERCQCLEDAFLADGNVEDRPILIKRSASPPFEGLHSEKRARIETAHTSPSPELLDVSLRLSESQAEPIEADLIRPAEPCGFCQEGSTCPCAELVAVRELARDDHSSGLPSPPQDSLDSFAPGTSEKILAASGNMQVPSGCTNKPATCGQCQKDSTSKQFCQSLAAVRSAATAPPPIDGIAGPVNTIVPCAAGQACCRISSALSSVRPDSDSCPDQHTSTELDFTTPGNRHSNSSPSSAPNPVYSSSQAVTGPRLSCADAFTRLSQHPAFEEASKDYGSWLPELATVPSARHENPPTAPSTPQSANLTVGSLSQVSARTAFDIEAASVMGVLKLFDRRFGWETK